MYIRSSGEEEGIPFVVPEGESILYVVHMFMNCISGALEVFVTPLYAEGQAGCVELNKQNCYGTGIYAGLLVSF